MFRFQFSIRDMTVNLYLVIDGISGYKSVFHDNLNGAGMGQCKIRSVNQPNNNYGIMA